MVLVCGATGELGGRVVRGLRAAGSPVRALVRPRSDTGGLRELGVELTNGDFRDAESLRRAVTGVETVVSTVTVIARALAGEKDADFHAVDVGGHRQLITTAYAAGGAPFVFVSAAGGPSLTAGEHATRTRQGRDRGPALRRGVARGRRPARPVPGDLVLSAGAVRLAGAQGGHLWQGRDAHALRATDD